MSKTSQDSKDDSDVIDTVTQKYFLEIEHSVPHMQQVLFDFQNECYKTWKNAINANISLHKEFLDKSGLDYATLDSMKSLVGTVGATGGDDDGVDALLEAVQVERLGEHHRIGRGDDVGVGWVLHVRLTRGVDARVGAQEGGDDKHACGPGRRLNGRAHRW